MRKLYLFILFAFTWLPAYCQVDMKNSLADLKTRFLNTKSDTQRVKAALALSRFYTYNKGNTKPYIDSGLMYATVAQNLSNKLQYRSGADDATLSIAALKLRDGDIDEVRRLASQASGPMYSRLYFVLGRYFLEKGGEEKTDLDEADTMFNKAQSYADDNRMPNLSLLNRIFKYAVLRERLAPASVYEPYFDKLIITCRARKNLPLETKAWILKSNYEMDPTKGLKYFAITAQFAKKTKDTALYLSCVKDLADYAMLEGKLDSAEIGLKNTLVAYRAAGYKNLQFTYDLLAAVYIAKGNFEPAMRMGIEAVKYAEQTSTDYGLYNIYYRLANLCRDMGLKKESLQWYQKCMDKITSTENRFPYLVYRQFATELIKQGRVGQVLQTLEDADKKYADGEIKQSFYPVLMGDCYVALKKFNLAEKYYLQALNVITVRNAKEYYYYWIYRTIASFYINSRQYATYQ